MTAIYSPDVYELRAAHRDRHGIPQLTESQYERFASICETVDVCPACGIGIKPTNHAVCPACECYGEVDESETVFGWNDYKPLSVEQRLFAAQFGAGLEADLRAAALAHASDTRPDWSDLDMWGNE